ncbi:hypothetical protein BH11PSE12_BH11PSE12_08280 [soil metagenome]
MAAIIDYEWSQFVAFAAAVESHKRRQQRDQLALQMVVASGDQKAITRLFKALED